MTDWYKHFRNTMTRISHKLEIKLGGLRKNVQDNEIHFFKMPKNHHSMCSNNRDWIFVAIEYGAIFFVNLLEKEKYQC